jgi:hypothetical protein
MKGHRHFWEKAMINPHKIGDLPGANRLPRLQCIGSIAIMLSLTLLTLSTSTSAFGQAEANRKKRPRVGLGKVLSGAHGGQIFGFDIAQHGTDGMIDDAVS